MRSALFLGFFEIVKLSAESDNNICYIYTEYSLLCYSDLSAESFFGTTKRLERGDQRSNTFRRDNGSFQPDVEYPV